MADDKLSNSRNIISLDEAKALGLKHYFTGRPCKHGHIDCSTVPGGRCYDETLVNFPELADEKG